MYFQSLQHTKSTQEKLKWRLPENISHEGYMYMYVYAYTNPELMDCTYTTELYMYCM